MLCREHKKDIKSFYFLSVSTDNGGVGLHDRHQTHQMSNDYKYNSLFTIVKLLVYPTYPTRKGDKHGIFSQLKSVNLLKLILQT